MSFKCTLTSLNKKIRKYEIYQLYKVAKDSKSRVCYAMVLMLMFEFICSYYYIDTDEDVIFKRILKEREFSSQERAFLNSWVNVRNESAHCQFPLTNSYVLNLREYFVESIFDNYEEDKNSFICIFKECCNALIEFDKEAYLINYMDILPQASVEKCFTKEDCDALLERLGIV